MRIVRGTLAFPGKWPWMCNINSPKKSFCGGSLIAKQWILTAAHCQDFVGSIVNLGQFNRSSEEDFIQTRRVVKSIVHEKYSKLSYENDICLLKLDSPVEYTRFVKPVCIADIEYNLNDIPLTVLGWGITEEGVSSQPLMETITYSLKKLCFYKINSDAQICCGNLQTNSGACFGDSGGPLMMPVDGGKFIQIGIVSYGGTDCTVENQSIFTKISFYFNWIKSKLEWE